MNWECSLKCYDDGEFSYYIATVAVVGVCRREYFPFLLRLHVSEELSARLKNKTSTRSHLLFYCTSNRLSIFRALLCPSSGTREYVVDYHIGRFVLGLLYVGG